MLRDDRDISATILGSNWVPFQELMTTVKDFDNGVRKVFSIVQVCNGNTIVIHMYNQYIKIFVVCPSVCV